MRREDRLRAYVYRLVVRHRLLALARSPEVPRGTEAEAVVIAPDTQRLLDAAKVVLRQAQRTDDSYPFADTWLSAYRRDVALLLSELDRLLAVEAERDTLKAALRSSRHFVCALGGELPEGALRGDLAAKALAVIDAALAALSSPPTEEGQ